MKEILKELNEFLGKASAATYAGGGGEVDPKKAEVGMKELEYGDKNSEWYYKDSYSGFLQSFGREVVWHSKKPFWVQIYGGGMEAEYKSDINFVHQTFDFLKKVLLTGDKINSFQPRGPRKFVYEDWKYSSTLKGNIKKFNGSEKIYYKNKVVFTHNFSGGLYGYVNE